MINAAILGGCASSDQISPELPKDDVYVTASQEEETKVKSDASTDEAKFGVNEEKNENNNEYDGTWYAQDESGMTLSIKDGAITLISGESSESTAFEAMAANDHIFFSLRDELFYFYEVNYYADRDIIEAYTWPMLDDDGGYKRTVFGRTVYEPGDTIMIGYLYGDWEIMDDGELIQEPGIRRDIVHFSLPDYHMMRFIRPNGDTKAFFYALPDDEYAYSAVNYEYSGREDMAHGGYFDPYLVYVTTDNRGQITEMVRLEYAVDGTYYDKGEVFFSAKE